MGRTCDRAIQIGKKHDYLEVHNFTKLLSHIVILTWEERQLLARVALIYHLSNSSQRNLGKKPLPEITGYLKEKIAEVRIGRLVGEVVWAIGSCLSVAGLLSRIDLLTITGFSSLFAGLYLTVHYELQRLDYLSALEKISTPE